MDFYRHLEKIDREKEIKILAEDIVSSGVDVGLFKAFVLEANSNSSILECYLTESSDNLSEFFGWFKRNQPSQPTPVTPERNMTDMVRDAKKSLGELLTYIDRDSNYIHDKQVQSSIQALKTAWNEFANWYKSAAERRQRILDAGGPEALKRHLDDQKMKATMYRGQRDMRRGVPNPALDQKLGRSLGGAKYDMSSTPRNPLTSGRKIS